MNSQKLSIKQVLIVGCGDLGKRLAERLPATDYQVTGVRRNPPPNPASPLHYCAADASDPQAWPHILSRAFDIIVITMTPSERSDEGYRRAYVDTCQHLLTSLKPQPYAAPLLLFVSSTAVYGQNDGSWVDEQSPAEPRAFNGQRLLQAESLIRQSGYDHCLVRFSGIYGPGRNRLIEQVRQGRAVLSQHYTNRIHADDCAGVLAHLIDRHVQGSGIDPLYIASDNYPAPMAEVVNWLAMQLKVNKAIFAPHQTDQQGNKRCSNQRLIASGYQFRYADFRAGYSELLGDPSTY